MQEPIPNNAALDLEQIAHRVRQALAASGVDGKEFADQVGVPYSTMRGYLNPATARAPSPEFLAGAFRAFGIQPSWLLTGEGEMTAVATPGAEKRPDFVSIPVLAVQASAGNGTVNEPAATYVVSGMAFSREWLSKRQLNPTALAVITVKGTSMEGALSSGDQLLINKQDKQPRSGFIYVLRQGDELLVKFCQLLPSGVLRVSSANQNYAPYDIDLTTSPDVEIVGRVVASMHEW
ncbi:hypothetical protein PEC18_12225 [Paucibacter sp. O1-1]|nr:hypothetical protein [Paucibacter sp. O1-1]MDA3826583.1 hypothetical protein [Paucibacter sp. O1-1]